MGPGDRAMVHVKWANWCGNPKNRPATWEIELADGHGVLPLPIDVGQDIPQCTDGTLRSIGWT